MHVVIVIFEINWQQKRPLVVNLFRDILKYCSQVKLLSEYVGFEFICSLGYGLESKFIVRVILIMLFYFISHKCQS